MPTQVHRFVTVIALIAGYALLLQAFATAFEIISRKLFNYSFQGVDEIGGYVLAIVASFGFGYAALMRSHTRVDFVLRLVPPVLRATVHVIAALMMSLVSAGMLWYANKAFLETLEYQSIANSPLETPLWIPQLIWLVGFFVFALVSLYLLFRAVSLFVRGDFDKLEHELGTSTPQEELETLEEEMETLSGEIESKENIS